MSDRPLLDTINTPKDLESLCDEELPQLAEEIRGELLDIISTCGGHLASNLGVVELTIALLRVFDVPRDRIVWDTGHQGYVYKLLTGRRELLKKLRRDDGCCGFLSRDESEYDVFGAGHAGTALSAALGIAAVRDRRGDSNRVLAVVGDGALGTGVSLEGLNSIIETTDDFILVINDNKMSIAPNVGALSRYLTQIISDERYNQVKTYLADLVDRIPRIGARIKKGIARLEEATKSMLVPGVIFEELGLRYIGPLDGHNLPELVETFESVARLEGRPLVVHVISEKGRGYPYAERAPEIYHGLSPFDVESGKPLAKSEPKADEPAVPTFSAAFGTAVIEQLEKNSDVVAITAGMCHGTGMRPVREQFPDRFFDVGIAEEHAVVLAAGMASEGAQPVVAIYASFMQRAMDYVLHDVCLQNLPVVFCLDRAGVVDDGPTHHGIHDLTFWRTLPNMAVLQPADAWEQCEMLERLLARKEPGMLRYPKGNAGPLPVEQRAEVVWGRAEVLREGDAGAIWAVGRESETALAAAAALSEKGLELTVVNARFVLPFDEALLTAHMDSGLPVITLENHCIDGGFATTVIQHAFACGHNRVLSLGWPSEIIPFGTEQGIRQKYRLTAAQVAEDIATFLKK